MNRVQDRWPANRMLQDAGMLDVWRPSIDLSREIRRELATDIDMTAGADVRVGSWIAPFQRGPRAGPVEMASHAGLCHRTGEIGLEWLWKARGLAVAAGSLGDMCRQQMAVHEGTRERLAQRRLAKGIRVLHRVRVASQQAGLIGSHRQQRGGRSGHALDDGGL